MAPALPSHNPPATNWFRKISPSLETGDKKETITQSIQDTVREKRGNIGTNYSRKGKMLTTTELIIIVTKTLTVI